MNYRHLYHAGHFCDVFKHILLLSLIQHLLRKEKPFSYVETHAGIGCYDLHKEAAQKTKEYNTGIAKLWMVKEPMPEVVADYLQQVRSFNHRRGSEALRYYPGSPLIVRECLRPSDRMILCELHARDILNLKNEFKADKQVAVHHIDGYQGLKAFLPPQPARGLVFIDPSYERPDEFHHLAQQLIFAAKRWPTGIFAAWYPIKDRQVVQDFYRELSIHPEERLIYEFSLPSAMTNLKACGMVILRPPWQWQQQVEQVLPWLKLHLSLSPSGPSLRGACDEAIQ